MQMTPLIQYVNDIDKWRAMVSKQPLFEFPLNQRQVKKLTDFIDSDLSPENLHCDGEASAAHVKREYCRLMSVRDCLRKYCEENSLTMPWAGLYDDA